VFSNLGLLIFLAPAILFSVLAQIMVKSAYSRTRQIAARTSGFAAARHILDSTGLQHVAIEQVPGTMSDHYDPRGEVLRLSQDVYHGRSMAAVGIAAHEAGHAIQDAKRYAPLVIRNAAVPVANFGSGLGTIFLIIGVAVGLQSLLLLGIVVFSGSLLFQIVNLPVEFDASARAKRQLVDLDIIDAAELPAVKKVLNAAALTYVAATLQSVMTLLYYLLRYIGRRA
jgi:hypothetical protein